MIECLPGTPSVEIFVHSDLWAWDAAPSSALWFSYRLTHSSDHNSLVSSSPRESSEIPPLLNLVKSGDDTPSDYLYPSFMVLHVCACYNLIYAHLSQDCKLLDYRGIVSVSLSMVSPGPGP